MKAVLSSGLTGLFSIVIILGIDGCSNSKNQQQAPPPPTVTVSEPIKETVSEWKEFIGRFRSIDRVEVRARVSGYLDKINFEDGQFVKKGDVLFVIDQRPFRIALDQANAAHEGAVTRLELAEKEWKRAQNLKSSGAVSQELLDQRQQEYQSARSDLTASEAAVNAAKLDLEFTEVQAPISGKISEHFVSVGNLISGGLPGATLLTRIVSYDPIYFSFEASGEDLAKYLNPDRPSEADEIPIYIKTSQDTAFIHKGLFNFVDNEIDQSTGTLLGRATFDNKDLKLTPGMFGIARFADNDSLPQLLIPDEAIGSDQSNKFVLVVDDSNKVQRRLVDVGFLYNNLRVIRGGLSETDRVIIKGIQKARPGQPVTAQKGAIAFVKEEH